MKALPLSDRILFAVASQRHNARSLAQMFRTDINTVYKVLGGLEDQDLVERDDEPAVAVWVLAEGVSVEYRPGRLEVERDGADPRKNGHADDGRCTATTTRGTRCKQQAVAGDLCGTHAS